MSSVEQEEGMFIIDRNANRLWVKHGEGPRREATREEWLRVWRDSPEIPALMARSA